jgi:hypothetical protein
VVLSGSSSAIRTPHSAFLAGLGKTAAAILAWLWRRRFADEQVRAQAPRRGLTEYSISQQFLKGGSDAQSTDFE